LISPQYLSTYRGGFQSTAEDNIAPSQATKNILIGNIVEDVNVGSGAGAGAAFSLTTPKNPGLLDHRSQYSFAHRDGNALAAIGDCCTVVDLFNFNNNILTYGDYGFKGGGSARAPTPWIPIPPATR